MTAEDHIIAYIESSAQEYAKLCEIARRRQPGCADGFISVTGALHAATTLIATTYQTMLHNGSADRDDVYSPADLARAMVAVLEWEKPE